MGEKTAISWTNHTFSPWWGCHEVSAGCDHCYARQLSERWGHHVWGPRRTTPRRFFGEAHWREPLKWDKAATDRFLGRVDRTTGEVLAPTTRALVTGRGNPDEPYPVPDDRRFTLDGAGDVVDAPEIEAIARDLIAAREAVFGHLVGFDLAFLWKRGGGSVGGKARFGQCVKPSRLARHYAGVDFVVWLAADHCRDARRDGRRQADALVSHELLHADVTDDGKPTLKPHAYEGFLEELSWYGPWQADLKRLVSVARQLPLFDGDEVSE